MDFWRDKFTLFYSYGLKMLSLDLPILVLLVLLNECLEFPAKLSERLEKEVGYTKSQLLTWKISSG